MAAGVVGPVGWCPVVALVALVAPLVVHSWWPTPNPRVETLGYYWEG